MSEKLRRGKERLLDGWDSLWEKLTSKIPRLPRPWRVALNLVCIPAGGMAALAADGRPGADAGMGLPPGGTAADGGPVGDPGDL